jgi:hypothetical protein
MRRLPFARVSRYASSAPLAYGHRQLLLQGRPQRLLLIVRSRMPLADPQVNGRRGPKATDSCLPTECQEAPKGH